MTRVTAPNQVPDTVTAAQHVARLEVVTAIAGFRSQIGRVFFFAVLIAHGRTDQERGFYRTLVQSAQAGIDTAFAMLAGVGDVPGFDADALAWARDHARGDPQLISRASGFRDTVGRVIATAESEREATIPLLLDITGEADRLFNDHYGPYLAALQDDLAATAAARGQTSRQVTEYAQAAMARIDAISRSVRLTSLNAAVEAARVGDAGRGFSVIAGEIKTLAESIAAASTEASECMDRLKQVAGRERRA
ncbi:MAG: methyl-accepting chemotaxis protein [Pseudomonadota bacterium]